MPTKNCLLISNVILASFFFQSKIPMSSSQSSQFPPKSIVKNKSYEGVEALRQIASTSLFLDNEQKANGQTIPTIKEPDEGKNICSTDDDDQALSANSISDLIISSDKHDHLHFFAFLEPPIELKKIDTLKVDTLNVIDIMSMTDEETEREIHQIDINQEINIPRLEPLSLFSDDDDYDEQDLDSDGSKKRNKLLRQRTSLNQSKSREPDMFLMESPLSPPPFSPPPLPLSPNTNIVTTSFNREVGFLSLPLTSTTMDPAPSERKHHRHHHHKHHHKHRHSTAVGRTEPHADRAHSSSSFKCSHQPPEREIVLSPSKLGQ